MVHVGRQRSTTQTTRVDNTATTEKKKMKDIMWWSKEKMDRELGGHKAEAWRKVLKWRPDQLTQSEDELLREYPIPVDWERATEGDLQRMTIHTENATDQDDLAVLQSMRTTGNGDDGAEPDVVIKVEKLDPAEQLQKKGLEVLKDPTSTIRRLQDWLMEMKVRCGEIVTQQPCRNNDKP